MYDCTNRSWNVSKGMDSKFLNELMFIKDGTRVGKWCLRIAQSQGDEAWMKILAVDKLKQCDGDGCYS